MPFSICLLGKPFDRTNPFLDYYYSSSSSLHTPFPHSFSSILPFFFICRNHAEVRGSAADTRSRKPSALLHTFQTRHNGSKEGKASLPSPKTNQSDLPAGTQKWQSNNALKYDNYNHNDDDDDMIPPQLPPPTCLTNRNPHASPVLCPCKFWYPDNRLPAYIY